MGRAPCCDKATVKKGPWSAEEDAVLKAYIDEHGTGGNWIQLPHKIGLNRCGKSCRLRWLNYLRPNIRHGGFTKEEDSVICSLYISIGSRWSTIAAQLPGRTDNDVKNHWNTKLKRRLLGGGRRPRVGERLLLTDDPSSQPQSSFTAAALERMQLGMRLHRRHERLESTQAFTLYNYSSSLGASPKWPSPSPSPSPSPAASDSSEMPRWQLLVASSSTGLSGFWSHMKSGFSYGCAGAQDNMDGTCTPPMSTITGETAAVGMESSSSTPTASSASATFGSMDMEDEIDMLLRQIQSFDENGHTGKVADDGVGRFFGEVNHVTLDGSAGSWSSCSTPGLDSVFQDFVQGYNQ